VVAAAGGDGVVMDAEAPTTQALVDGIRAGEA
jgi:hypothetical protein